MISNKFRLLLALLTLSFLTQAQISDALNLDFNWDTDTFPLVGGNEYSDIWGFVDCAGKEYAIIGSTPYIHVFDITDQANLEVGQVEGGGLSLWRDIKTYAETAYAVADQGSEGLLVIDLSDLQGLVQSNSNLSLTNRLDQDFQRAHNIYIDQANSRLYVAGSNTRSDGLLVYDLFEDPLNPTLIADVSLDPGAYVHDLYVRDNIAYCSHGWNGYYIWDFKDAQNPILLANTPTNGYNHSSWLTEDGRYAFVAEEVPAGQPLLVIDLQNMLDNDIEIVHSFKEPLLAPDHENNTPHNPFIRGDHLYVSYYEDGVQVFDITDPLNPIKIGYYDTDPDNMTYNGTDHNWGVFPFFPSGNVIASDSENGLFVLIPEFQPAEIIHLPIVQNWQITGYNCDTKQFNVAFTSGYLNYRVWDNNELVYFGASENVKLSAGNHEYFINNGDCTSNNLGVNYPGFDLPDLGDPAGNITADGPNTFCENANRELSVQSNTNFGLWFKDGVEIPGTLNARSIIATEAGDYWHIVLLHASDDSDFEYIGDCGFETNHITLTTFPVEVPNILNNDFLLSTGAAISYQWYKDGELIDGATDQFLQVIEDGAYYVVIEDVNGCFVASEVLDIIISSTASVFQNLAINITPNPANSFFKLQIQNTYLKQYEMNLYNAFGELLQKETFTKNLKIDVQDLSSGVYFVECISQDQVHRNVKKVVVAK